MKTVGIVTFALIAVAPELDSAHVWQGSALVQGSPEDVALAIESAPPAQRHVCGFLEGRAAVVLSEDAGDADVAAACAHALLLHRRELVRVRVACLPVP